MVSCIFLALLLIGGCATTDLGSAKAEQGWRLLPQSDPNSVVAQTRSRQALVSVLCMPDGCRLLIVDSSPCDTNLTIPVLINTEVDTGIATADCLPSELTDPAITNTGAVFLTEPNLLLPQIVLGDEVSIAVPGSVGGIKVYIVKMKGLHALMQSAKPDVFIFPEPRNEDSANPYGLPEPPEMNENQLNRWRRNLDSV